jgi:hypothetical protein
MIVVRIMGGLGNQMFQYAFGAYLASRHNTELWLDCSALESDPLRDFMLDRWQVTGREAPQSVREMIPRKRRWYQAWSRPGRRLRRVAEKPFGFRRRYLETPDDSFLDGYWQSEQFLPGMKRRLGAEFQPAGPLSAMTQAVAEKMTGGESVSLHVRRTDYLSLSYANPCPLDYYEQSVAEVLAKHAGVQLFVFSDDIPWCRQQFDFPCPVMFVDHNDATTAHEDMWLMSRCRHHIIANSTFSWWGAWLGVDETGEVYAPQNWFADPTMDSTAIVPGSWRRIPRQSQGREAA